MLLSKFRWNLVFGVSKSVKTLIRSRFQGMYWCAHKITTITSIQHTVTPPPPPFSDLPLALHMKFNFENE